MESDSELKSLMLMAEVGLSICVCDDKVIYRYSSYCVFMTISIFRQVTPTSSRSILNYAINGKLWSLSASDSYILISRKLSIGSHIGDLAGLIGSHIGDLLLGYI